MKEKLAPPELKTKNAKPCSGLGPMYPRDKPPKIPIRERIKDKIQNKGKEVEGLGKSPEKIRSTSEEYNVLAHLCKIPALLSIFT
jgi:hypothetical protein